MVFTVQVKMVQAAIMDIQQMVPMATKMVSIVMETVLHTMIIQMVFVSVKSKYLTMAD